MGSHPALFTSSTRRLSRSRDANRASCSAHSQQCVSSVKCSGRVSAANACRTASMIAWSVAMCDALSCGARSTAPQHALAPNGCGASEPKGPNAAEWCPFVGDTDRRAGGTPRSTASPIPPRPACAWLLQYPLHGLLTSLLMAPPARPLDQIYWKVGVAQLGDEVGGDGFPGAGFGVPDHVVESTILHARNIVLIGHHRASRVQWLRPLHPDISSILIGRTRTRALSR